MNRLLPLLTAGLLLGACAKPPSAPPPTACHADQAGLVDVTRIAPTIRTEARYATTNNFTGAVLPGYTTPRALLRPDAAQALARVQDRLRAQGLGLMVWDAYRPVRATRAMVDWAERSGNRWVVDQGYVAERSGHNTGGTVDLTLVRLADGAELDMGTPFDEFSERAHTANATGDVARNRQILLDAMAAEGFANYPQEWWHFSYTGAKYEPLDCVL